jgi:hypothetical protein
MKQLFFISSLLCAAFFMGCSTPDIESNGNNGNNGNKGNKGNGETPAVNTGSAEEGSGDEPKEAATSEKTETPAGDPALKAIGDDIFQAAGYDAAGKIMLLQFGNGAVYRYSEVPEKTYKGFLAANNKKKYFESKIKKLPVRFVP